MPAHRTRPAVCVIENCDEPANRRGTACGYCTAHYWRIRRTGFAECYAEGCHQAVGVHGWAGLCYRHAPREMAT